jgi:predicted DNA-binding transcriptional regulator AlpA
VTTTHSHSIRLRIPAAAAYLGMSRESLKDRRWRTKHGIPFYQIGRAIVFDQHELDMWLYRQTAPKNNMALHREAGHA